MPIRGFMLLSEGLKFSSGVHDTKSWEKPATQHGGPWSLHLHPVPLGGYFHGNRRFCLRKPPPGCDHLFVYAFPEKSVRGFARRKGPMMARPVRDDEVLQRRLLFWYSVRLLTMVGTVGLLAAAAFTPGEAAQMIGGAVGTGGSWWLSHERLTASIDKYLKDQA